jgi:hypothetical protein
MLKSASRADADTAAALPVWDEALREGVFRRLPLLP